MCMRAYIARAKVEKTFAMLPDAKPLHGFCLSKVVEDSLKFMTPQLAGLRSLILLETYTPTSFVQRDYDFQVGWADR